jgi:tRNA-2-methylthio-N6-dimethylallyladenosine synthase
MLDSVLEIMARYPNICNYIHLPVQSGSTELLEKMNRGYTREWYMERILAIRRIIPGCGISSDIITGFCSETEEQHQDTLSLMEFAEFDFSYMYKYSERPKTLAERKYKDDISEDMKSRRLTEIIHLQGRLSTESNKKDIGKTVRVLVEGFSKRSEDFVSGRCSENKMVVFPKENYKPGDLVDVLIHDCTQATLLGKAISLAAGH